MNGLLKYTYTVYPLACRTAGKLVTLTDSAEVG